MLTWNVEQNGLKNRYERYFSALAQRNPIIVFHTYLCTCDISVCWIMKKNTLSTSEFLTIKILKLIKLSLQTGPSEARCFGHPVVGSSLQSEASEEQQPVAQQPSPQSGQLRWVFTACSAPPPWALQETLTQCLVMLRWNDHRSPADGNTSSAGVNGRQVGRKGRARLHVKMQISVQNTRAGIWKPSKKDTHKSNFCRMSSVLSVFPGFSSNDFVSDGVKGCSSSAAKVFVLTLLRVFICCLDTVDFLLDLCCAPSCSC